MYTIKHINVKKWTKQLVLNIHTYSFAMNDRMFKSKTTIDDFQTVFTIWSVGHHAHLMCRKLIRSDNLFLKLIFQSFIPHNMNIPIWNAYCYYLFQWYIQCLLVVLTTSMHHVCPDSSQRKLAAEALCNTTHSWFNCLYDENKMIYTQFCRNQPDFQRPGMKLIVI